MPGPAMRWMLLASGPLNLGGAVLFAPPIGALRDAFGLPPSDPFYLWILSAWVLAFGAAYSYMGYTGRVSRGVIALGAWGKLVFALLVMSLTARWGLSPLVVAGAVPDLVMAATFAWWLWTTSGGARPGAPA
jgi:hypothetical protein